MIVLHSQDCDTGWRWPRVSRLSNQQLAAPKSRFKNSSCGMIVDPASTSLDIHLWPERQTAGAVFAKSQALQPKSIQRDTLRFCMIF
jgi:hypothetical protein